MTDRELMQQALDALEKLNKDGWILADFEDEVYASIEALRARLAQPEPEPMAWWDDMGDVVDLNVSGRGTPLYFAPPQREWQGLTNDEVNNFAAGCHLGKSVQSAIYEAAVKLKKKNG